MELLGNILLPEVRELIDQLLNRGYTVSEVRYDEALFGDALIVFKRRRTRVRLVHDRGQWFVEAAAGDEWYPLPIWQAFLDSLMPSRKAQSFGEQAQWLLGHLTEIEGVNHRLTADQLESLRSWRSRLARALGFPTSS